MVEARHAEVEQHRSTQAAEREHELAQQSEGATVRLSVYAYLKSILIKRLDLLPD